MASVTQITRAGEVLTLARALLSQILSAAFGVGMTRISDENS